MTLHLPPAYIERHILANIAMYENSKWPSATTRNLAQHWRECLLALHGYQDGRIDSKALPLAVKEIGWQMPAWGTYGS